MKPTDFQVLCDPTSGQICDVQLFGQHLLDRNQPLRSELWVNGAPLKMRPYPLEKYYHSDDVFSRFKGERYVDHFTGWGLVCSRTMGTRWNMKHPAFGIHYTLRREKADQVDLPCPGPGGPTIEAPLHVDTFGLLNLNWTFWGEDTRMIFPSSHSSGPADEFGHVGYEHDTPEQCKKFMQNVWRRIYPGVMVIHGGVFYNVKTGHWVAITCRRPDTGYILNIENAGRGVSYDFTLHSDFGVNDSLVMPEIVLYFGETKAEMWQFMADYVTHFTRPAPDWMFKTLFRGGLAWSNEPTWTQQADLWERELAEGLYSGISYSLVSSRPLRSGTTPISYHPDPYHGNKEEFKAMCRRLTDRGVPMLFWMSHSGLMPQGSPEIDDDWFIRGIDGRYCAAWGHADCPGITHINPGHPGYIDYTKKWLHFYIKECGMKGVFMDCLGWAFPADFRKRSFMGYPGDTNAMAIRFIEECAGYVKELDPEAVFFGEGTTFDAPVDLASINHNPKRSIDGFGPRDYLLELNKYTDRKRMVLDQGAMFSVAAGFAVNLPQDTYAATNRAMTQLLREEGGARAFKCLPGELAVLEKKNLLVVPLFEGHTAYDTPFTLPEPWGSVRTLRNAVDGSSVASDAKGTFTNVPPGLYNLG